MKAEDAKLPGAGISPKPCPRKCVAEKGRRTGLSGTGETRTRATADSKTARLAEGRPLK